MHILSTKNTGLNLCVWQLKLNSILPFKSFLSIKALFLNVVCLQQHAEIVPKYSQERLVSKSWPFSKNPQRTKQAFHFQGGYSSSHLMFNLGLPKIIICISSNFLNLFDQQHLISNIVSQLQFPESTGIRFGFYLPSKYGGNDSSRTQYVAFPEQN